MVLGQAGRDDLSLPMTAAAPAGFKTLREAFYEAGAQLAHGVGARW